MKYTLILRFLQGLVYAKRFFWWLGREFGLFFARPVLWLWTGLSLVFYKIQYWLKKIGLTRTGGSWIWKRDVLQAAIFVVFLFVSLPQTKLYAKKDTYFPGQQTLAFNLFNLEGEDYDLEEVVATADDFQPNQSAWREGALSNDAGLGVGADLYVRDQELAGVMAGGSAFSKPGILPGTVMGGVRDRVVDYVVEPGDSLSSIAYEFNVSIATILWENNLGLTSTIRPGNVLRIPPTTGVMYIVKKGDTIKKIATTYSAKTEEIIAFNKLREDGSDLTIGERIMIPNGVKPQQRAIVQAPRTTASFNRVAVPAGSSSAPSARGFVWPSAARTITQYYGWSHHAVDIAGPWQSATYAAKAGTVLIAQCGWNSGYGCYIVIDHGGGVKTLYGHHSKLLVSPGDHVEAGQTIGLMGNTGKVRGVTGIHLHFEIQISGVRVNPLGYIR